MPEARTCLSSNEQRGSSLNLLSPFTGDRTESKFGSTLCALHTKTSIDSVTLVSLGRRRAVVGTGTSAEAT